MPRACIHAMKALQVNSGPLSVDGLWIAPEACGSLEDPGDVRTRHGQVHSNVHAFMAEVIGNGQALDASAIAQRVTDKVQAPCLIDPCGSHQRSAFATVLLALVALADSQALLLVQTKHLLVVGTRKLALQHVVHAAITKPAPLHGHGLDAFSHHAHAHA